MLKTGPMGSILSVYKFFGPTFYCINKHLIPNDMCVRIYMLIDIIHYTFQNNTLEFIIKRNKTMNHKVGYKFHISICWYHLDIAENRSHEK